ncbi:hypothetical protein POV27_18255 [Aureisphaera galaxeae]|uniref:hypothetical protein n=1 Tax=Aureisphaera galaxeae TaxID=1538023 RepID=UPI002350F7A4|nr:hypothetical protein [Aureisphaera galaxeae]MDC8006000.1 hypothetical protein [Aureisphaera galaxeae]
MKLLEDVIDSLADPKSRYDVKTLKEMGVPEKTISKIQMIESPNVALQLAMNASGVETLNLASKLKLSLEAALKESQQVQNIIKIMFSLTFALGYILIGIAIYFGWKGETFLAAAFGGFGMLSIVTLLLKDPPLKMQDSRSNYAQLTLGILAWLNDLNDKGAMASLNQNFVTEILKSKDESTDQKLKAHKECIENYLSISNTQVSNTVRLINLIEDVAEPSNKHRFSLEDLLKAEKGMQQGVKE